MLSLSLTNEYNILRVVRCKKIPFTHNTIYDNNINIYLGQHYFHVVKLHSLSKYTECFKTIIKFLKKSLSTLF